MEREKPEVEVEHGGYVGIAFFYIFSFGWLSCIPVFAANSEHYGFGLIPGILSAFIIPVLFLVSIKHLVHIWQNSPKLWGISIQGKLILMVFAVVNAPISLLCFLFFYLA